LFSNDEIAIENLPSADSVAWRPMDGAFVRRQTVDALIVTAIVTAGIGFLYFVLTQAMARAGHDIALGWLWILPVSIGGPLIMWPRFSVPKMGYAVREHDVLYRSGVFWRHVTIVPFNRIQHVEKSSTPLDRRFGVACLKLYTAGGAGGDLKIAGLGAAVAETLRKYILQKIGDGVDAG